jgi:cation-transporting ATPase 13A2
MTITLIRSSRFIPPQLDKEKSNIENSENTSLFLTSCYEYILSGIVLGIGPPFRQSMSHNRKLFASDSEVLDTDKL